MENRIQKVTSEDLELPVYVVDDEDIVYDDGQCIKFKYYDKEKDRVAVFYAQQIFIMIEVERKTEGYSIYTCLTEKAFLSRKTTKTRYGVHLK